MRTRTFFNLKSTHNLELCRIRFHQGNIAFFAVAVKHSIGKNNIAFISDNSLRKLHLSCLPIKAVLAPIFMP